MEFAVTERIYEIPGFRRLARQRAASRVSGWASERFFRSLSMAGRLHPLADPAAHGVEVIRDLTYADGGPDAVQAHGVDVYRPAGAQASLPTVLYIHGGAFQSLSKETHWIMGLAIARHGCLVVVINYRLAPRHRFPSAVEDVANAFRWTVRHAAEFGGDPRRIAVAGESAGANLALALMLMTAFERPEPWARTAYETGVAPIGCLPACGLLQVSDARRFARRRRIPRFARSQIEGCESAYLHGAALGAGGTDLADPLVVLESDSEPSRPLPPVFTIVGTRDPLLDDTRRLERALARRGVDVQARYYPGGVHAFHAVPMLPYARQSWAEQLAFLDRVSGSSAGTPKPKAPGIAPNGAARPGGNRNRAREGEVPFCSTATEGNRHSGAHR